MVKNVFLTGKAILTGRQKSLLSAAATIMVMLVAAQVLGLIRQRVLAHFFSDQDLAVYFAAFRLPETIFAILVSGALSAAFIPVFTSYFSRGQAKKAWDVAAISQNIAFLIFAVFALFIFIFADSLSPLITPGFPPERQILMSSLTRVLLLVQGLFLFSFFLTGVLESRQRFLVPALAPIFYNLGIILGAATLSHLGVWGAAIGAVFGAFLHFAVQLPLALSLGFRYIPKLDFREPGVRTIARLALPRVIEVSALQVLRTAELILASLVSIAAYTYLAFANTLQFVPVGLFGFSIAKASLPTLSVNAARGEMDAFRKTFSFSFTQILFFVVPFSVFLAVLRIPLVRLIFGTARFSWEATVQTGQVVSAFALGIAAQAAIALLARSFYALQDTRTPVKVALLSILLNIALATLFVKGLGLGTWSLALAFSIASIFQSIVLFILLDRRVGVATQDLTLSFFKVLLASGASGAVMFFLLKVLDRSAWDKKLSFLGQLGLGLPTTFDRFVLDTRYVVNLFFLTALVATVGALVYLAVAAFVKLHEVDVLFGLIQRLLVGKAPLPKPEAKEPEPVIPTQGPAP